MLDLPLRPSARAQELFDVLRYRVQGLAAAERLWQRHLNDTEKRLLGTTLRRAIESYPRAPRLWALPRTSTTRWP